eukprot:389009_1
MTPTMAPTQQCKGEISQSPSNYPQYDLLSTDNSVPPFDYQGLGWHYYFFPCDMSHYTNWPFFLLSYHERCQKKRNGKDSKKCIGRNKIIINTKPNATEIDFTQTEFQMVKVGSGITYANGKPSSNPSDYSENNKFLMSWDDSAVTTGIPQRGDLEMYFKDGSIVIDLIDVLYMDYPRTCNKGQLAGADCGEYVCEDTVIHITDACSHTVIDCPGCFRNIACGLGGKYVRMCTESEMNDSGSRCYDIFQGSNGTIFSPPIPPFGNDVLPGVCANSDDRNCMFISFAETWHSDVVHQELSNNDLNALFTPTAQSKNGKWKKHNGKKLKKEIKKKKEN